MAVPAQTRTEPVETRELVVGTKLAPPFSIRSPDGHWRGLAIDLWRRIADQLNLSYRLQETTLDGLIDGVAAGRLDAAVAAVTVTAPRERRVDFTQPYYATGLGIAVAGNAGINWWPIVDNLLSFSFLRAVLVLFAAALLVGVVIWLIENRHNEHFGKHHQGLASSLWWSAAAMTQSGGSGEKVPVTLAGRLIAIAWMVASVIVVASFTAALTSQLTLKQLQGKVHGEADLRFARTAAVAGTETVEYLDGEHIVHTDYPSLEAGLEAVHNRRADALVYDRPLLLWLVNERYSGSLQVLDAVFDPQVYAIALPPGSKLRVPINLALIDAVRSDWWRRKLIAYTGRN